MEQHTALCNNSALLEAHPAMASLVALVGDMCNGDSCTPVWSLMYDKQTVSAGDCACPVSAMHPPMQPVRLLPARMQAA